VARNVAKCSRCGMELDVSGFEVGQTVACQCGTHLTVPPPGVGPPEPPPGPRGAPQAPPYHGPPLQGEPWPGPPPGPYGAPYMQPRVQCPEATHALVFGILGFVIGCLGLVFGPIAISKANEADRKIKANPHLEGSGMALAGKILGIIGVIYGTIAIIYLIFIAIMAASFNG
jgi:hypothetical protein